MKSHNKSKKSFPTSDLIKVDEMIKRIRVLMEFGTQCAKIQSDAEPVDLTNLYGCLDSTITAVEHRIAALHNQIAIICLNQHLYLSKIDVSYLNYVGARLEFWTDEKFHVFEYESGSH